MPNPFNFSIIYYFSTQPTLYIIFKYKLIINLCIWSFYHLVPRIFLIRPSKKLLVFSPKYKPMKLRKYKNYLKTNKWIGSIKFKHIPVFFFYNSKIRFANIKKINLQKLFTANLWITNVFFTRYRDLFWQKFYPLVGLRLSPFYFSLRKKKKWLITYLKCRFKRNRKFRNALKFQFYQVREKMRIIKNKRHKILNDDRLRAVYYFNMFYFFKLKLSYRSLKFLGKIIRAKAPVHTTRNIYNRPYLFLNNNRRNTVKTMFPLKNMYHLFKLYKKLFYILKKKHYRIKKWGPLWFKRLSSNLEANRNLISIFRWNGYSKKLPSTSPKRKSFFLILKQPLIQIVNTWLLRKNKPKNLLKFSWKKVFLRSMKYRARKPLIRKYLVGFSFRSKKLNKYFKRKARQFFFLTIRQLERRYISRYVLKDIRKRFIMALFIKKKIKTYFFNNVNFCILDQIYYTFRRMSFRSIPINFSSFLAPFRFFPKQSAPVVTWIFNSRSKKHKKLIQLNNQSLLMFPSHRCNFILGMTGFLLLTNTLLINYLNKNRQNLHILKKLIYSFPTRNDLPKHLLKKNTRYRFSIDFKRCWRKKYKIDLKQFSNFHKREFVLIKQPLDTYPFAPVSNLKSIFFTRCSSFEFRRSVLFRRASKQKKKFNVYITRIRYKPGYPRQWRESRAALQILLQVKFQYQHRLTKFIFNYKNASLAKYLPLFEMRLFNILTRSRIIIDHNFASICISQKLVFVNGVVCDNPYFQVFAGDFIQLIVSLKYYIAFRWLLNNTLKIKKKIKHLSWKVRQRKKIYKQLDKEKNHDLPLSVLSHKHLFLDVAKFLEVDFFTLSIFVLYDPFLWNDLHYSNVAAKRFGSLNMYNWKYIT